MVEKMDLLLVGGHVLDPYTGRDGRYDIGIKGGRVAGLYPGGGILPAAAEVIDVDGDYLSPGWIDLHVHVADGAVIGIDADTVGVRQGVTTIVDAGSTGSRTFPGFVEHVISKAKTRVLAWLNVSRAGLFDGLSELADLSEIDEEETLRLIAENASIRGIKVRMSSSVVKGTDIEGLRRAKTIAAKAEVPVFVHIGNQPPKLTDVLDLLGAGDVVTHIFHGKPGGCLNEREEILPQLQAALRRGVYIDLGHGTESCSFHRMRQAHARGLMVDTISTDLYSRNYEAPVRSLSDTMEKCMALGMTLHEVIAAVTARPAAILRMPQIGSLRAGSVADLTRFAVCDEVREYVDAEDCRICGHQTLAVKGVVREGSVTLL